MNRYMLCRRLMAPAILLLLGVVALLNQAGVVGWKIFVPLLLILIGLIKLAERAALAAEPYPRGGPYDPGAPNMPPPPGMYPYPGQTGPYASDPAQQASPRQSRPDEEKL